MKKNKNVPAIGTEEFDVLFPVVEIGRITDEVVGYHPASLNQRRIIVSTRLAIRSGMKNFRRPAVDPSFDDGKHIVFVNNMQSAVGASPLWWEKTFKVFLPEKNSRLIYRLEKDVFLTYLVQLLYEAGESLEKAFFTVCDSKEPPTRIGIFTNLGINFKIGKDLNSDYILFEGTNHCLAYGEHIRNPLGRFLLSTGEMVLDE